MPYRDELHFMYLFLKATLETEFPGLICERADKQAMAGLLTDKIQRSITSADVIIADCTGANPNVFYELGIAHTLNKETILLTADTAEHAPTDVRGYEFIPYRLDDERNLLAHLTQALQGVLSPAEDDYEQAKKLLADYAEGEEGQVHTGEQSRVRTAHRKQAKARGLGRQAGRDHFARGHRRTADHRGCAGDG